MSLAWATLLPAGMVHAQGISGPSVSDSKVGYIDDAIPGDVFRLRFDSAYNNRRPSRAEFFYARNAPAGPGVPVPEPSLDYQELSAYLELSPLPALSAFLEVPTHFLNPDRNANAAGLADMNAGFKYAFLQTDISTLSFQFRTFAPTGDSHRGLGTHHTSLEPAFLYYQAVGDRAGVAAELRYWIPIGGTEFAGDVIRYGVGAHYEIFNNCRLRIDPVVELVGWTVLDGKEGVVHPSGLVTVQDAEGDTIVNFKAGLRFWILDGADIYAGYGRPLTGERWYENIFRLEMRLLF